MLKRHQRWVWGAGVLLLLLLEEKEKEVKEVKEDMKVSDFEKMFHDKFGLNVQVFRKSGNLWMQTTSTDHWTLAEQNRKGGSSELHYKEKYRT